MELLATPDSSALATSAITPGAAAAAGPDGAPARQSIKDSFRALVFSPNSTDPTYQGLQSLPITPALSNSATASLLNTFDDAQTVPDLRAAAAAGSAALAAADAAVTGSGAATAATGASTSGEVNPTTPQLRQVAEEAVAREFLAMQGGTPNAADFLQTPFLLQMQVPTPMMKQHVGQIGTMTDLLATPALPMSAKEAAMVGKGKPPPAPTPAVRKPVALQAAPAVRPKVAKAAPPPLAPAEPVGAKRQGQMPNIMMKPAMTMMPTFFMPYAMPVAGPNGAMSGPESAPQMYPVMMGPGGMPVPMAYMQQPMMQPMAPKATPTEEVKAVPQESAESKKEREENEKAALTREFKKKTREAALVRFRQKRRERRFGKHIRYDCRKKLADARPRVKGRFVRSEGDGLGDENQVVPEMAE